MAVRAAIATFNSRIAVERQVDIERAGGSVSFSRDDAAQRRSRNSKNVKSGGCVQREVVPILTGDEVAATEKLFAAIYVFTDIEAVFFGKSIRVVGNDLIPETANSIDCILQSIEGDTAIESIEVVDEIEVGSSIQRCTRCQKAGRPRVCRCG